MKSLGSGSNLVIQGGRRTFGDPGTVPAGLSSAGGGGRSGFKAAQINRLTMDFIGRSVSADQDLFGSSIRLRARARELAINNALAIKFLAEVEQNVVGENGIQLQAKVTNDSGKQTAITRRINFRIEQEWKRWCKLGSCTADGGYTFADLQRMAVRTCAAEGESIVKEVYGRQFNDTAYALQPLDNDQLDDTMMLDLDNGDQVRMGVQVNRHGRPQFYHLWATHPNDLTGRSLGRMPIPADQIKHTFIRKRPSQRRGYTWMSGAILNMNQLERYIEAVEVAARASAAKFGVVQKKAADGDDFSSDDGEANAAADPAPTTANAGDLWYLEEGEELNYIDPRFPTNNHEHFVHAEVRNIATALLTDYPTLGNDLEGVNFSSIRAGMLDVRDCWRILQRWFAQHFVEPIFKSWLRMALLTTLSDISITPAQMDQMVWHGRGWDWVDPLKDTQANALAIQNAFTSHSRVLASKGIDLEELVAEIAAENELFKAAGITVGTDIQGVADTADDSQEGDGEDAGDDKPAAKRSIPFARVLSVESRTPQQIADALENYRKQRALPLPSEA